MRGCHPPGNRERRKAALCSEPTTASAEQPSDSQMERAAHPHPPAAECTSTREPSRAAPSSTKPCQAVSPATSSAAPSSYDQLSGNRRSSRVGDTTVVRHVAHVLAHFDHVTAKLEARAESAPTGRLQKLVCSLVQPERHKDVGVVETDGTNGHDGFAWRWRRNRSAYLPQVRDSAQKSLLSVIQEVYKEMRIAVTPTRVSARRMDEDCRRVFTHRSTRVGRGPWPVPSAATAVPRAKAPPRPAAPPAQG
eukprot:scaffold2744_cov104-Isochrysis_galbana.AAC.4